MNFTSCKWVCLCFLILFIYDSPRRVLDLEMLSDTTQPWAPVLVTVLVAMAIYKYNTQMQCKAERVCFGARCQGVVDPPWWGRDAAGAWGSWFLCIPSQEAGREECGCLAGFLLYSVRCSRRWDSVSIFWEGPPSSVKSLEALLWTDPERPSVPSQLLWAGNRYTKEQEPLGRRTWLSGWEARWASVIWVWFPLPKSKSRCDCSPVLLEQWFSTCRSWPLWASTTLSQESQIRYPAYEIHLQFITRTKL